MDLSSCVALLPSSAVLCAAACLLNDCGSTISRIALSCSMSLSVLMLCTIFYKYLSFTELPEIVARMSREQHHDYDIAGVLLSLLFIGSVFGALFISLLLLAVQAEKSRRQRNDAKASLLHTLGTGKVVDAPRLLENSDGRLFWHVFLSHTWKQVTNGHSNMCTSLAWRA